MYYSSGIYPNHIVLHTKVLRYNGYQSFYIYYQFHSSVAENVASMGVDVDF